MEATTKNKVGFETYAASIVISIILKKEKIANKGIEGSGEKCYGMKWKKTVLGGTAECSAISSPAEKTEEKGKLGQEY